MYEIDADGWVMRVDDELQSNILERTLACLRAVKCQRPRLGKLGRV